MGYISQIPAPPLNAYIDDLYYIDGPAPYPRQKVLPNPAFNLMVNLRHAFEVYDSDQGQPFVTCSESWWVGLWSAYHIVDWPPNVQFYGVHFKPGGAYPFLQLPLSELHNQVVPMEAIWGPFAAEIRERLQAAPSVQAGLVLFERLLLARLGETPHGLDVVRYAMREVARHQGTLSIRTVSDQLGISQNHLDTQFKRLVGISPKVFARLYRFGSVLSTIDVRQPIDWGQIAHDSGFYDQSHFNKDFAAFTGDSPTDYLHRRRRFLVEKPEQAQFLGNLPID